MLADLLENRRSIRKFKPDPVPEEQVDQLVTAALRAPSSRGFNPWEFIVVKDPQTLEALSRCKPHGASFLKNAPLGIVVLADTDKTDVWVEDTAIATTLLHLAATDLGLGSCWIQIRKRDFDARTSASDHIRRLLEIPDRFQVTAILAVGYPDENRSGHPEDSLQRDKVYLEAFSRPLYTD